MEVNSLLKKHKYFEKLVQISLDILCVLNRKISILVSKQNKNNNVTLILSLNRIGDSVFTFPAIRLLKDHIKTDFKVFVFEENKNIFELFLNSDRIITISRFDYLWDGRIATSKVRKKIRSINPSIIVDLTGTITSATSLFFIITKQIIGMNSKYFRKLYDKWGPLRNKPHLMERYLEVASSYLEIPINDDTLKYPFLEDKIDKILIHPLAGWKAKEWGLRNFILLAKILNKSYSVRLIFPKDSLQKDIIESITKEKINFIECKNLKEMIEEIKQCSLFIGNDTGPLYVSNVLGKATFTIYGPTNPEYSLPFGHYHEYIQLKLKCSPDKDQYCFTNAGLNCPTHDCTSLLSVNTVAEKIENFISRISKTILDNSNIN